MPGLRRGLRPFWLALPWSALVDTGRVPLDLHNAHALALDSQEVDAPATPLGIGRSPYLPALALKMVPDSGLDVAFPVPLPA